MEFNDLISISGKSGLFKMISSKNNGIIAEDLDSGKKQFYSVRMYQFSPLGSIGIYTYSDVIQLIDVFRKMIDCPPKRDSMSKTELREYMLTIVPEHDVEKVYVSDIKKLVRWFNYLNDNNLLQQFLSEENVSKEEE